MLPCVQLTPFCPLQVGEQCMQVVYSTDSNIMQEWVPLHQGICSRTDPMHLVHLVHYWFKQYAVILYQLDSILIVKCYAYMVIYSMCSVGKGPFTQDGGRWVTIEWSTIGLISQRFLKGNKKAVSVGNPCVLIDLSAISSSGSKNLVFIERLLRDHWEIDEIVERSLSVRWKVASLSDHWEIVLDWVKTLRRLWQLWRWLDDHWQIIERSWWLLGDHWALFERSLRDLAIFSSLNDLSKVKISNMAVQWY